MIHTLQKNPRGDAKRNNLVLIRNLDSFVHQHARRNVAHVKIRLHSDIKAIPQGHVSHTLQKNPRRDAERNNLVLKRSLDSSVHQHARGVANTLIHQVNHQFLIMI